MIGNYEFKEVMEAFIITENDIDLEHFDNSLIGQKGVRAKRDLAQYTAIGQYYGNEILSAVFDKFGKEMKHFRVYDNIYSETSAENVHGRYSWDLRVETKDYTIDYVLDPLPLELENERALKQCKDNIHPFLLINDCRKNIESMQLSKKDKDLSVP